MSLIITSCCENPAWIELALSKIAQLDGGDDFFGAERNFDENLIAEEAQQAIDEYKEQEKIRQEKDAKEEERIAREKELSGQLVDPFQWGKGRNFPYKPIGIPSIVKRKAQKAIASITNGFHSSIPLSELFDSLLSLGLVPIQEDGYRWEGMLLGGAECGTDEANNQHMNLPIVMKDPFGEWALTTAYLHMTWCKMRSDKYEVVCYLS